MAKPEPKSDSLSLFALTERYPDEQSAILYFEDARWGGKPTCPKCDSLRVRKGKANRRIPLWRCAKCGRQFTVTSGTVLEHTMLPLRKWLLALHLIGGAKKGVSARYLARTLDVTPQTAWHLGHRIRALMTDDSQLFKGIVETDETYIGGKRKHVGKGYRKNKIAVQTIIQRNKRGHLSKAQTIALQPNENVDGRTLGAKLRTHTIPKKTILMTDEYKAYSKLGEGFKDHHTVNHKKEEYVRQEADGHLAHTNSAEGFFGNLKRQINGTHHHVSKKHLPKYLEEFDYKFNMRGDSDGELTTAALRRMTDKGRRLTLYQSRTSSASLFDRKRPGGLKRQKPAKAKRKTSKGPAKRKRTRGRD